MRYSVYQLQYGLGKSRPEINYHDPRTTREWQDLDEFEEMVRQLPHQKPLSASFWSHNGLGAEWDFVSYPGLAGALSERLTLKLAEYSGNCFWFIPIKLDNQPYYIPAKREPLDCLDRARTQLLYHPTKSDIVIGIKGHRFRADRLSDPRTFCIPEGQSGKVFATSGVKQAIEQMGVFGVDFKLLDTIE